MVDRPSNWKEELARWLEPFLDCLGHKARRRMCPLYVAGLIGPGDRKSVQPMAARLAPGDYDQLHHFIADGAVFGGRGAVGSRIARSGRSPRRRQRCSAGHRRYIDAEEGRSLGWCSSAICINSR